MSTKNLARTVIEGGRHRQNVWQRRRSNSQARTRARELSGLLRDRLDPDAAVYRKRTPVRQEFDDKLRPAQRWLEAQAGRPWDKVRSELFARFDTRTTAGRHIVFDHLLQAVERVPRRFPHRDDMFVDRHGLLRKIPCRRKRAAREQPSETQAQIDAWLAGRRVGTRDHSLFWLLPTQAGYYRQDKPLTALECQRWHALPNWYRELLHEHWQTSTPPKDES
jgi:hypothetical protein